MLPIFLIFFVVRCFVSICPEQEAVDPGWGLAHEACDLADRCSFQALDDELIMNMSADESVR